MRDPAEDKRVDEERDYFRSLKNERAKLETAYRRYFEADSPSLRELYGSYLARRVRPAIRLLIERRGPSDLARELMRLGGMGRADAADLAEAARAAGRADIVMTLLSRGEAPLRGAAPPGDAAQLRAATARGREARLCRAIFGAARDGLAAAYPALRAALRAMRLDVRPGAAVGTDGLSFVCGARALFGLYRAGEEPLRRVVLHSLAHCLMGHPIRAAQKFGQGGDGADIEAERLSALIRGEPFDPSADHRLDDHSLWGTAAPSRRFPVALRPEELRKLRGSGARAGAGGEAASERLNVPRAGTHDFAPYLRRYAFTREETIIDPGCFDYIPYINGLARYGNVPLIEPLEYSEVSRVEELVIAIDTSGSCSADTVRRFLSETYGILSSGENFFSEMNVYIIQCDWAVRDERRVTCGEEFEAYLDELEIRGRGDTDFRPVFSRVEELRASGALRELKGLLYFTDGDGIFPESPTDYETAFVFMDEKERRQRTPAWAAELRPDCMGRLR